VELKHSNELSPFIMPILGFYPPTSDDLRGAVESMRMASVLVVRARKGALAIVLST